MIARSRSPTTMLPASLILSPREQKQYRRFISQTTTLPPKDHGYLPTATQYADFQSWLAKRDSGYLSDTPLAQLAHYVERASENREDAGKASTCGHALHPSHTAKTQRCPVCLVNLHVAYMKVLTVALTDAGGMVKQRWEAVDYESPALQAWYTGKLAFVREMCRLEVLSKAEQEYDLRDRNSTSSTNEVKTATQALKMYWDGIEANPSVMRTPKQKKSRAVVFCPETSFERGRDQPYFWRKSPRYEAGGKYASSSSSNGSGEEESEDEECRKQDLSSSGQKRSLVSSPKESVVVVGRCPEDEDDEDEDEDEDDVEDEDVDDAEIDDEVLDMGDIVFEAEEVVVPGAEFIVFED